MRERERHLEQRDAVGSENATGCCRKFILQLFLDSFSLIDRSNRNDHACATQEQHLGHLLPNAARRACDDCNFAKEIAVFAYLKRRSCLAHSEEC